MNKELVFSISLSIFSIFCFITALGIPFLDTSGHVGPGFFAIIISGLLVILSIFYSITCIKSNRYKGEIHIKTSVAYMALLFLTLVLTQWLGFLIPLTLFSVISLIFFAKLPKLKSTIFSVVFITLLFFIFSKWLRLPFPTLIL